MPLRNFCQIYVVLLLLSFCSLIHGQSATTSNVSPTPTTAVATTASASASKTATGTKPDNSGSNTNTSTSSVNFRDPAGGVSMLTPAATDASSTYYKIGATVTLSWNYTSVQVTPSSVVVQAYCPTNKYYYPVASNLTLNDTRVLWDTSAYEANTTQPLLTAMYILYIMDSSRKVTDIPQAGVLGSNLGFAFGILPTLRIFPLFRVPILSLPFTSHPGPGPQVLFTSPFMMSEIDGSEYVCDLQFCEKIMGRWDFMEHGLGIHNCDRWVKSPRGMRRHGFV